MAATFDSLVSYLRRTRPSSSGEQEDDRLLAGFVAGNQSAFTDLVVRYAPLVWGVCRRVLPRPQDAEDAFQAVFLVLARKAPSLCGSGGLGPWLHRVASRTAVKARARVARLASRETRAEAEPPAAPSPDLLAREARVVLDEEVSRLPDKYRLPVVLCYLEGLTNEEAARRLACPHGTVLSRLSRAREQLRGALTRRGFALPAALLAGLLGEASARAAPAGTLEKLLKAGPLFRTGTLSASASTLAEGVLTSMLLSRLKIVGLVLLTLALAASGAGLFANRPDPKSPRRSAHVSAAARVQKESAKPQKKAEESAEKPAKKELKPAVKAPASAEKLLEPTAISRALARTVDFAGLDDPKTPLSEVLEQWGKQHGLQFDINEKAFQAEMVNDPGSTEVVNPRPIPAMKASLRTVLKKVLARVPVPSGAVYLIRKDHIEITTENALRAELGRSLRSADESGKPADRLPPLVWEDFRNVTLEKALADLAEATDSNVVLDPRAEEKPTKVSARLANVPLDTAVGILADLAGLGVVRLDNVLYVTSRDNAKRLKADRKKD
jgi:RNA polymerase sigma factor (sigma-70 family)